MNTRSAILTLYGDYVQPRGGAIATSSLLPLLADFDLRPEAVRLGLSRLSREGLLRPSRHGGKSYYHGTRSLDELLSRGAAKLFGPEPEPWSGAWHLVAYSIPESRRPLRDRLRQELAGLGFGQLTRSTWLSPYDSSAVVAEVSRRVGVVEYVHSFDARLNGGGDPRALVARCWDLETTDRKHREFLATHEPRWRQQRERSGAGRPADARADFIERFLLLHDYRRHYYFDPELPDELLPEEWAGREARRLFLEFHAALSETANAYVEAIFETEPAGERVQGAGCRVEGKTTGLAREEGQRVALPVASGF